MSSRSPLPHRLYQCTNPCTSTNSSDSLPGAIPTSPPAPPPPHQTTDVSVQLEALDILADLLCRFGSLLVSYHASILEALLPQLCSPRLAVRKRSVGVGWGVSGIRR